MITAILLAAGQSKRLKDENKLTKLFKGKPLINHILYSLIKSKVNKIIIVLGFEHLKIKTKLLKSKKINFAINKNYKKPNQKEKEALKALVVALEGCDDKMLPEDIQTIIYSVGKESGYKENLRDWFKLIYQVVFGDDDGPRMGFFISFFGVNETKQLITNKIK